MGKFFREITTELREFIEAQHVFFVSSAACDGSRINLSPKGLASLAILDDRTLAYYDLPGSGNETANHIVQDGRVTCMWCSFEGKPLILRAYCIGEIVARADARFAPMMAERFPTVNEALVRQIVLARVESLQTSCGFGVPLFNFEGDRETLTDWAEVKLKQGKLEEYVESHRERNDRAFPVENPILPSPTPVGEGSDA